MAINEIHRKYFEIFFLFLFIFLVAVSVVFAEESKPPKLTSGAAVLVDANTGQVLYEKNMNQKLYPASITKIMTGLLALEKGKLTDNIVMSKEAVFSIEFNSSHIALNEGEVITLEQALYAIAVASANDASNGIAELIAKDMDSFGRLMTARAKELGAEQTNFVNAHGLPDHNHYTTPYDMAKIMMYAVKNPQFLQFFSEGRYEMQPTNLQPETRYLNNTNSLLRDPSQYEGIIASKKGWTSDANHTLVTAAKRGERVLIVVAMNNQSADDIIMDTKNLLDYGFNEFSSFTLNVVATLSDAADNVPEIKKKDLSNIASDEEVTILLHNNVSPDKIIKNITVTEDQDKKTRELRLVLAVNKNGLMYDNLGGFNFSLAEAVTKAGNEKAVIPMGILQYVFVLALIIFLLRLRVYIRRRRRRARFVHLRSYRY